MFNIITLVFIFTVIDFLYLSSISGHFKHLIQTVQNGNDMEFDLVATFFCYIALVFVLWYFIIRENRSPWEAALLGWSIYAVYETTNKATLKDWTWQMVMMDTMWGGILFATTTWIYQTINTYTY